MAAFPLFYPPPLTKSCCLCLGSFHISRLPSIIKTQIFLGSNVLHRLVKLSTERSKLFTDIDIKNNIVIIYHDKSVLHETTYLSHTFDLKLGNFLCKRALLPPINSGLPPF